MRCIRYKCKDESVTQTRNKSAVMPKPLMEKESFTIFTMIAYQDQLNAGFSHCRLHFMYWF